MDSIWMIKETHNAYEHGEYDFLNPDHGYFPTPEAAQKKCDLLGKEDKLKREYEAYVARIAQDNQKEKEWYDQVLATKKLVEDAGHPWVLSVPEQRVTRPSSFADWRIGFDRVLYEPQEIELAK